MIAFLRTNLLWSEGIFIAALLIAAGLITLLFCRPLFYVVIALFLFCLFFFRNPERICQEALSDSSVLVCPADGKVVDVQTSDTNEFDGYAQRVSIFLSVFDVHVNFSPIAGTVKKITYRPGQFKFAFLPKASEFNERNDLLLSSTDGKTIQVRQIAGTIARKICCWVQEGQQVAFGQKYGMIRFGSRVDILLPKDVEVAVGVGQRVYGGQTVLGRWK